MVLKRPKKMLLNKRQCWAVLGTIFGKCPIKAAELTDEDCQFAQALLTEAVSISLQMGIIEDLWKASHKAPSGLKAVLKSFLKAAGTKLIRNATRDDLQKLVDDPQIYRSVLGQLKANFRSVWALRVRSVQEPALMVSLF